MVGSAEWVISKRVTQKRGTHLKPRIVELLEKPVVSGSIEQIKYIGLNEEYEDLCAYFEDAFALKEST